MKLPKYAGQEMITISKAEYDLIQFESTMFYEIDGVERLTPTQLNKLTTLDKQYTDGLDCDCVIDPDKFGDDGVNRPCWQELDALRVAPGRGERILAAASSSPIRFRECARRRFGRPLQPALQGNASQMEERPQAEAASAEENQ